ncbi:BCCT family transporter [Marinobacter salicampi]|uniref:BCCT family transporter n=1 Tax=Marinobacter salicampi TaxID=435907 RepID=UPI00140B7984|nr:BCCT family transporter [Marinobacter salicampi]
MEWLARKLRLKTNPTIFFTSAGIMVVFLVLLLIAPGPIGDAFGAGRTWIVTNLGWLFILGVTSWVAFLLWVALSRYGVIRLGGNDAKPDYGNLSWFTMLFAGGIGTVLMFWGVAEPISHFASPPRSGVEPFSVEAADDAMGFSIYHLGLHTWAIFTLPGLAFAYFIYRYDLPMRFSSVFYSLIGDRIYGPLGKTLDIFAVLGTLFGVAVSVGLGTQQINAGLTELFGVADSVTSKVIVITVLTTVAVGSIVAGLDSGIKRLSNLNISMAVGLMFFVLFTGSTVFLLRALVETFGLYITNLLPMAFWNDALAQYDHEDGGWGWQGGWTVFYWAWTVTWSPFIGIFIARISRGRTIREFVLGVLFAPSIFTLVWFSIFGWSAMEIDGIGAETRAALGAEAGSLSTAVEESIPLALFAFFENFPGTALIQGLAVVIVAIFFATSSDSASLVVDMLCTGSPDPGPWHQRVFWGVSEGVLAAMLIVLAGEAGLTALQEVITVVGLPMFVLVFAMMVALFQGLSKEDLTEIRVGKPPPVEELKNI